MKDSPQISFVLQNTQPFYYIKGFFAINNADILFWGRNYGRIVADVKVGLNIAGYWDQTLT